MLALDARSHVQRRNFSGHCSRYYLPNCKFVGLMRTLVPLRKGGGVICDIQGLFGSSSLPSNYVGLLDEYIESTYLFGCLAKVLWGLGA